MNTLPAQEIKRRGVKAIELALQNGPVHIIKNNSPACVVISEAQYAQMTASRTPGNPPPNTLLQWLLHKKADGDKTKEELDAILAAERNEWDR